jgi:2-methylcitrate dehydratase PrpD
VTEFPGGKKSMGETIAELVKFASETKFEDLPEEVVFETKRILLDSIGSALGGLGIDKGKIAIKLARRLSGSGEASIIGTSDKVSYFGAAFANGELIQTLDYDPIIFPAIHATPFVLAAPLVLAEGTRASGKELIRAIAIALEISVRFGKAFPKKAQMVEGKVVPPPVRGYSWTIFGGTAAAGLLLGLDPCRMAHALGIAGLIAPVSARQKFMTTLPVVMSKHLMAGWVCGAEITAALLAEMEYIGDTTVFEGEYGFWRFSGYRQWDPDAVVKGLGENWQFVGGTNYKLYPCCGVFRTALDCFIDVIAENDIQPKEIESVRVYLELENFGVQPIWQNTEIRTPMDAQFSAAFNFALAAHRVKIGPEWQELSTLTNQSILDLMKKISVEPHPNFAKHEAATADLGKVEVVARGKKFKEERRHAKGSPSPEGYQMTDNELVDKFRHQALKILPVHKVDKTKDNIFGLEYMEDTAMLMKDLTID